MIGLISLFLVVQFVTSIMQGLLLKRTRLKYWLTSRFSVYILSVVYDFLRSRFYMLFESGECNFKLNSTLKSLLCSLYVQNGLLPEKLNCLDSVLLLTVCHRFQNGRFLLQRLMSTIVNFSLYFYPRSGKLNNHLEAAIHEAMSELDKMSGNVSVQYTIFKMLTTNHCSIVLQVK